MMLTTKGRYAVIAIVDIASFKKVQKPVNLFTISERQNIAVSYLEQIFIKLKQAKIVNSIKGPGGGYILNQDASMIKIDTIIDAVNENINMTKCSKDKQKCLANNMMCNSHFLWLGLGNKIREYLSNISVADVLENRILI